MSHHNPLEERIRMLRHNEAAVQIMLRRVDASDDVIAAIIDTRDELGLALAAHLGVEGEAERVSGPERIPTIIAIVRRLDARRAFTESHPKVSAGLAVRPPPGRLPVVVIASGGITLVHVERTKMGSAGEA